MGGLGLANPASEAEFAYATARQVTKPLVETILGQNERPMAEVFSDQHSATIEARRAKAARLESQSASIKDRLPQKTHWAVIAAEEKGASTWLTALPLADFGCSLSKSEFRDALHLRYCWTPPRLPASCVCGQAFTVEHALSCSHGGYLGLRHNEVRDLLGEVQDEICVNVSLEPALKPLDGEQLAPTANSSESARVNIKAGGFGWESRHECAFFDVRVFYPHARSHRHRSLPLTRTREAPTVWRTYLECGTRNIHTPGILGNGWCWPGCHSIFETAGRQVCVTKVIFVCTGAQLDKMPSIVCIAQVRHICLRGARTVRPANSASELRQPDLAVVEARLE